MKYDLKTKLKVEIRPNRVSYMPNRRVRTNFNWIWFGLLGAVVIIGYMYYRYDLMGLFAGLGLVLIYLSYDFIEKMIKQNIRFDFDKNSNAVYRAGYWKGARKLMPLDEVVIFTHTSEGSWEYRVGKKGKQFMKSYKISPAFGDGKKEEILIAEFEQEILQPLKAMLNYE